MQKHSHASGQHHFYAPGKHARQDNQPKGPGVRKSAATMVGDSRVRVLDRRLVRKMLWQLTFRRGWNRFATPSHHPRRTEKTLVMINDLHGTNTETYLPNPNPT
jgi:hypothetical protein